MIARTLPLPKMTTLRPRRRSSWRHRPGGMHGIYQYWPPNRGLVLAKRFPLYCPLRKRRWYHGNKLPPLYGENCPKFKVGPSGSYPTVIIMNRRSMGTMIWVRRQQHPPRPIHCRSHQQTKKKKIRRVPQNLRIRSLHF